MLYSIEIYIKFLLNYKIIKRLKIDKNNKSSKNGHKSNFLVKSKIALGITKRER